MGILLRDNIHTHIHTLVIKPYTYKVFKNERTTDKGEVGGSSPPRPTIFTYDVLSKEAQGY